MARTLNLVAVSGSLQRPSRTLALVEHLVEAIGDAVPVRVRTVELGTVGPRLAGALYRNQLPPEVEADIAAVEQADVLVVGSPVYRATYSGLFKHFFDFVHHEALVDVPVLLAATGGSERHALVIDHQLRPLFSFFQARTLPLGCTAPTRISPTTASPTRPCWPAPPWPWSVPCRCCARAARPPRPRAPCWPPWPEGARLSSIPSKEPSP